MELRRRRFDFRKIVTLFYVVAFATYLILGFQPTAATHYEISGTLSIPSIGLVSDVTSLELKDHKLATPDMFTHIKDIVTVYGIIVDKDLKIKELQQNKQNNEQINNNILNIASLLNNPKPNRSEDDV